ncbi:MAG: TetR/AcrR family transcriptional regulator [Deltaproteobacteria bacterium]|nr:TetR/AcrR family transcriptional regulator [Deltaproteobacteria bacterium]
MAVNKAPEQRREEIFEAALSCFNSNGYHQTTIDEIAAQAGISKGGIYHHFSSKKELVIELFRNRVNRYFEYLTEQVRGAADAAQGLNVLVEKSVEIFQEHEPVLRFCLDFVAMSSREPEFRAEVAAMYRHRVATVSALIQEGIRTGIFKQVDSEGVGRALYFLSMGFFLSYFTVPLDFDPQEQHRLNLKTIMDGLIKNQ